MELFGVRLSHLSCFSQWVHHRGWYCPVCSTAADTQKTYWAAAWCQIQCRSSYNDYPQYLTAIWIDLCILHDIYDNSLQLLFAICRMHLLTCKPTCSRLLQGLLECSSLVGKLSPPLHNNQIWAIVSSLPQEQLTRKSWQMTCQIAVLPTASQIVRNSLQSSLHHEVDSGIFILVVQ